jgi:Zn-dependent M28 family amino/carboxypeptidase
MRRIAACALLGILSLSVFAADTPSKTKTPAGPGAAAKAAEKSIDPEYIRATVKFLSSDLLEGRGTGQRGGDIAAEYIAAQFASYGLKPAGDNGSYLQRVPLVGIATESSSTFSLEPRSGAAIPLKLADDIVAMDESQSPSSDIDAPIVFVGYGISAPEYKWDDYKGVDVRGKVVLMFVNEPPSDDDSFFKGKALTYYGRWTYKYEEAARRGAVGAILIHQKEMASYGWEVVRSSWGGERSSLRNDGKAKLKLASWIQLEVARKLLAASGQNLDEAFKKAESREFQPVDLGARLKAHVVSRIRPFESANVIAIAEGSDPRLKSQAVIYSAHYDHLGIHPDQPGDNIYNGAVDNATGCGVLLEMARAFATATQKPRRSVIFAAVTAEEQGLLGSAFLADHPPLPAGNITLGLNFDSFSPYGIPEEVRVSGSERTTFYATVEQAAKDFQMAIRPDANPGAGGYYRSDHFSFARVGIPAFSLGQGGKFRSKTAEEIRQKDRARGETYHQPSDEYQPYWDFSGLAYMARFGVDLGWRAADQPELVGWQKGDEFEAARRGGR